MLVQQVQQIGQGVLGESAAATIRHVAEKNHVTEIVWPNGAGLSHLQNPPLTSPPEILPDYASAFRNSPVAMAIATLGGSLMDCNAQFCETTQMTKEQVSAQTIFTLVDKEELGNAFDKISQWLFATGDYTNPNGAAPMHKPIVLKSIIQDAGKNHMQVCLTPVKENRMLRYLCVTLTATPPIVAARTACSDGSRIPLPVSTKTQDSTTTSFFAVG
jgi:PAS domain